MDSIREGIFAFVAVIIIGLLSFIVEKALVFLKQKGLLTTLQMKKESVTIAVNAIEQIARNEKIPDKFKAAKKRALQLLNAQGITITDDELQTLIEATVAKINETVADITDVTKK